MARTTKSTPKKREQWSGQAGFIFAAIGSAVGLGNIWRFPGVAYENGGGAFILPYLIALLTAGIPILFIDYALGNRFRGAPPTVFRRIRKKFEWLGWFQTIICFVIILYYAVIIAWAGSFAFFSLDLRWGDDARSFFTNDYLQVTQEVGDVGAFVPHILFGLLAVWIVTLLILGFGVQKGLERTNIVFIPLLVVLFAALVIRALFLPGAMDGLNALFTPHWAALADPQVWLAAYSQIFFSLSIAFGIMITYSSYIKKRSNLTGPGLVVGFANSSFEVLAGIGVFSTLGFMAQQQGISIADMDDIKGVMLSFVTFPSIVASMPGGSIFGFLFFASLVLAGLTSLVSLLQVVSASFQDKFGWDARQAAVRVGAVSAVLSILLFAREDGLFILDVVDKWTNEIGIVGSAIAMLVALLAFGMIPVLRDHLNAHSSFRIGKTWQVLVSIVVPVVLLWMMAAQIQSVVGTPYSNNPVWFNTLYGWGAVAFIVLAATIMTLVKWKQSPDEFVPEPTLPNERIYAKSIQANTQGEN
ncbi:sodium-dependent transporter [Timonella sp. A28]|uniref:sodium-dependent transporter n=1 Tax=Timonella sp. A28 TaxID=3442640 RepID=UPI003EC0C49D